MAVIVDTAAVEPDHQFSLWAQSAAEMFEPIGLRPARTGPFQGRAEAFDLGSVKLLRLSSDAAHITRNAAMVRRADPEWIQVMLQTGGRHTISQDGRSTSVTSGDIVAWQSTTPYRIDVETAWSGLIVVIPLALLGPCGDRIAGQSAQRFDTAAGPGLLLRHYLLMLQAALQEDSVRGCEQQLGEGALDLIRALYLRSDRHGAGRSATLRRSVLEHIEARLGEPTLSAPTIAAAHFVSRSHLDHVFEAEGTTVGRWIRHRRLERCRRDLLDSGLAEEAIFSIASRWGFVSQAHFSRAFRASYGQSPSEMRQSGKEAVRSWHAHGDALQGVPGLIRSAAP